MKQVRTLRQVAVVALLIVSFLFQGTWALAGTTGGVSLTVTDENGAPVAGASVTLVSPSQTANNTTDASGHANFLNLAPDTYTVSLEKQGFNPTSYAGLTVFADQQLTLSFKMTKALKEIAKVTTRASGNLVKPGATSNIYSVNATTQEAVQGIGGGNNINSFYSALTTVPGVQAPIGGAGWGQTVFIRGSAYDQIGYEYDGVPVNRAFDNYNANTGSNLGQQELQVYTGGGPAGSSSASIGGFINQVIKTGTYPGFGTAYLGLGAPAFYHNLKLEAGGASPNRLFSWYAGVGGYDQDFNVLNNQNGGNLDVTGNANGLTGGTFNAGQNLFTNFYGNGTWATCDSNGNAPTGAEVSEALGIAPCYSFGPFAFGALGHISDRESVVNFHFGIPHKHDSGRDDIQLLYSGGSIHTVYNDSINDMGGYAQLNKDFQIFNSTTGIAGLLGLTYTGQGGPNDATCGYIATLNAFGIAPTNGCAPNGGVPYFEGYIWPNGTTFGQSATGLVAQPYYFPNSPSQRSLMSSLDPSQRSTIWNDQQIIKAQYTKNIGSNAYVRAFAYTFYSDWLQNSPNEGAFGYNLLGLGPNPGGIVSPDYELSTHTRGAELQAADQINAQNLLRFTANYTTASVVRMNNGTWRDAPAGSRNRSTNLVGSDGNCYSRTTGNLTSCFSSSSAGTFQNPAPGAPPAGSPATLVNAQWLVTTPGGMGTYNTVSPAFSSYALEDEFRPNDKIDVNLGLRLEQFKYNLQNLNNAEYNFWFSHAAQEYCVDPVTQLPMKTILPPGSAPTSYPVIVTAPGAACPTAPSGQAGVHPTTYTNVVDNSVLDTVVSPRVGITYTMNPDTVLRFAFGKYAQPVNTAFLEYGDLSGKQAATNDFSTFNFWYYGYNSPEHNQSAQTSYNYDASLEKHLKGTDMTFKLTPFYRLTTNETVSITLGPNFVSGLNVGRQKSSGLEFQLQKGDPSRDGLSGAVSLTLTNTKIRYLNFSNGKNGIDVLNNYIQAYNCLTSAGSANAANNCAAPASQCYAANGGGAAVACTAANAVVNPYFNAAQQSQLDRNGWYEVYPNAPPGDPGSDSFTAINPTVITAWLNWKKNKLSITPNMALYQGTKYGSPVSVVGIDPRYCNNLAGTGQVAAGSPVANQPDYQSCSGSQQTATGNLAIPNPYTGSFDAQGQYRAPWQLNIGAQVKYDFTPRITGTLILSSLVNRCFGGDKPAWANQWAPNQYVCSYYDNIGGYTGSGPNATPWAGFYYPSVTGAPSNGTAAQPLVNSYPYQPVSGANPFQAYFNIQVKL